MYVVVKIWSIFVASLENTNFTATLQFFAHLEFAMFTRNIILMVLTNNYILVSNEKLTKFAENSFFMW